jgi:predicted nucleic acid-binding protein
LRTFLVLGHADAAGSLTVAPADTGRFASCRLVVLDTDVASAILRQRLPERARATWIAACCLVNGLPLVTFNTKDFADFAQYDGLELLDVS